MAETSEGKKKVYVHSHTKEDGTQVRTHYRSTPNTSTGKKKISNVLTIRMCPDRVAALSGLFSPFYLY